MTWLLLSLLVLSNLFWILVSIGASRRVSQAEQECNELRQQTGQLESAVANLYAALARSVPCKRGH